MIGFMFIVAILFFFSCQDDSVAVNQPDVLKPSDIPGYEKYYKPSEFAMMDMFSRDAKWSFYRHKQSEHFIVFWEVGFGKDPNAKSVSESMRVDVDDLLAKAEQFYLTNIETLKFAEVGQGKSYLCRFIDTLNMGLIDELIVGKEVLTRWREVLIEFGEKE